MNKRLTRVSKYLAFILRHEPQSIGMKLDADGYLQIADLVRNANQNGKSITVEQLREVVDKHESQMFEVSDDGERIRMADSSAATAPPETPPETPQPAES